MFWPTPRLWSPREGPVTYNSGPPPASLCRLRPPTGRPELLGLGGLEGYQVESPDPSPPLRRCPASTDGRARTDACGREGPGVEGVEVERQS